MCSVTYELKADDISHLVKCLAAVSHKWEEIGIALELDKSVREQCRNRKNIVALTNILTEWVQGNESKLVTLAILKKALGGGIVGHGRLAQELIPKFAALKDDRTHRNGSSNGVTGIDGSS